MKESKTKSGSASELAEIYPAPKSIDARIIRVEGDGGERRVVIERVRVAIYKLPIEQLARAVQVLDPVLSVIEGQVGIIKLLTDSPQAFYQLVAEATGFPIEDIARFDAGDFLSVLNGILQFNADFFLHRLGLLAPGSPSGPGHENTPKDGDGPKPSPSSASGASPIPAVSPFPPSALQ